MRVLLSHRCGWVLPISSFIWYTPHARTHTIALMLGSRVRSVTIFIFARLSRSPASLARRASRRQRVRVLSQLSQSNSETIGLNYDGCILCSLIHYNVMMPACQRECVCVYVKLTASHVCACEMCVICDDATRSLNRVARLIHRHLGI